MTSIVRSLTAFPTLNVNRSSGASRLPLELWREIFHHATYVPGGYDTLLTSPFDASELTEGLAFLERLKTSHSTKQAIRLVSHTWHTLSQDLIFEYLFLRDNYSWSELADGLEYSARQASGPGHGHGKGAGWYVRRIEISANAWTEGLARDAARIVRACPNLKVVSVGSENESSLPHVLVSAVLETCPKSLRGLDWTCGLDGMSLTSVLDGMTLMTELRTLFLCVEADLIPTDYSFDLVVLPKLHTLEIVSSNFDPSDVLCMMADWDLPALRQVTLTGQSDLAEPGPFFWEHGHKLKTLEFDYAGELQVPPEGSSPSTFDPTTGPEALLLNSYNLSELILSLHWAQLQASPGHETVKSVGIRGLHLLTFKKAHASARNPVTGALMLRADQDFEQQAAITALERLFPLLLASVTLPLSECAGQDSCISRLQPIVDPSSIEAPSDKSTTSILSPLQHQCTCTCRTDPKLSHFPSLQAVRLLDFDQARFGEIPWRAKRVAFWRIWVKRFEERGVRLEDHKGELIRVNFSDVSVYLPEDEREARMEISRRLAKARRLVDRLRVMGGNANANVDGTGNGTAGGAIVMTALEPPLGTDGLTTNANVAANEPPLA